MMYLLAISLGPVQDFIAAARRTADLQAGSEILVEMAKAAAGAVADGANTLIFPADLNADGPNKILVLVRSGDPAQWAAKARAAAQNVLNQAWEKALVALRHLKQHLDAPLADSQIERFLEFYAAWYPMTSEAEYSVARVEVDRLLAGRKALRDFAQYDESRSQTRRGQQKSPLDPSRDCVIHLQRDFNVPDACDSRPLWLKKSEALDAVSIAKRIWGVEAKKDVPSTSQMAARGLLPELRRLAPEPIAELEAIAKKGGSGVDIGDLVFHNRREEVGKEAEGQITNEDITRAGELCKQALRAARRSEFPPYYVILLADGDRMGKLLGAIPDLKGHQAISTALSKFAKEAEIGIIPACGGHAIYTGGDDVLGLLPVPRALECAEKLATHFHTEMKQVTAEHNVSLDNPESGGTLSVGLVIVHAMEPLQQALEKARAAEKAAKNNGRNSLAVCLHTRGGEPRQAVRTWGSSPQVDDWQELVRTLRGDLARGFPYELRALARECAGAGLKSEIALAEALRILRRKKGSDASGSAQVVARQLDAWLANIPPDSVSSKLEDFAQKLVIARFLAEWKPRQTENQEALAHVE